MVVSSIFSLICLPYGCLAMLFASGATEKCGRVDNGDTITDSMDIEKRRGITVRASTTSIIWKYTLILHPKIAI